jgi:hypothetical protein
MTNTTDIETGTAAARQLGRITVERLGHGHRPVAVAITGTGDDFCPILGLPEVEHCSAVGVLETVGEAKGLNPESAVAGGRLHAPRSRALVAAIAERNAGSDAEVIRLAAHRQFKSGGSGLDARRTAMAGHSGLLGRLVYPTVSLTWVYRTKHANARIC